MADFDYVIVGGGSAGAVLANRLSANPATRVCLIEAGPADLSPIIAMPLGIMWLMKNSRLNWLYQSTPQQGLGGRALRIPRGKVLGGSSAINGMIYVRGQAADYDHWARLGCTGWAYDDVLPYFRRSEANADLALDDRWHGRGGPLSVTDLRDPHPLGQHFFDAAEQLQYRRTSDFNTPEPEGMGLYQVTQKDGYRHSTAAAFLAPIRARKNLKILTGREAVGLELREGRARGVRLRGPAGDEVIRAGAEVILAAGAIGSPDLLLRSGIGPGAELTRAGIAVAQDLPGVGRNLQEHPNIATICRMGPAASYGVSLRALPALTKAAAQWVFARRGMLSSNMVEAGGFVRSGPEVDRPDIQFHLVPGLRSHRGRFMEWGHGLTLSTCILRPKSRGSVSRKAPAGSPEVDLGILREAEDMDLLLKGTKIARRILAQPPLGRYRLREVIPGPEAADDDALRAYLRQYTQTVHHPVGTCAMGTGPDAVLDPRLAVRGVAGLRVVDASVMPRLVSGNTNAPVIMIAEKAADLIMERA